MDPGEGTPILNPQPPLPILSQTTTHACENQFSSSPIESPPSRTTPIPSPARDSPVVASPASVAPQTPVPSAANEPDSKRLRSADIDTSSVHMPELSAVDAKKAESFYGQAPITPHAATTQM